MALHRAAHAEQAAQLLALVVERPCRGLAHRLERGKVHGGVDAVALEQRFQGGFVADVGRSNTGACPTVRAAGFNTSGETVGEVVDAATRKPAASSASQVCEPM